MTNLKIGIIGAGNGAHAHAGHLSLKGFPVRLFNVFAEEIAAIQEQGGVTVEGVVDGFGPVELATTDPAPVVGWADVLMVVTPAFAHKNLAQACAPHLKNGQIIVLNPGRTGGALEFARVLRQHGVSARLHLAETQSLLYACRISGPARVRISGVKQRLAVAAFPAIETEAVLNTLTRLHPEFVPAANVLETGFNNIGAVFHPGAVVLNANRTEAGAEFEFYTDMTPAVARLLEAVDGERLAVARAFGIEIEPAKDWLLHSYDGVTGDSLFERIQSNRAYRGIKASKSLNTRHIIDDVPTGLVPIASLGALAGIDTPACRAIADLCGILLARDFWAEGRNVESLGLAGMSIEAIGRYVETGERSS